MGRFISRDTIGIWGDEGSLGNGYAYAGNNPSSHLDPTDERWKKAKSWGRNSWSSATKFGLKFTYYYYGRCYKQSAYGRGGSSGITAIQYGTFKKYKWASKWAGKGVHAGFKAAGTAATAGQVIGFGTGCMYGLSQQDDFRWNYW